MTLTTYVLIIGVLLLLCLLAMRFVVQPTRPCPQCTLRVRVSARRCRRCGYQFTA
jgi:predicted amidophosphoribosyltransferase